MEELSPGGQNPQTLTLLVLFNISLLPSPVLFLEERTDLKFGFLNHSGSTGVFITTIRIKSFLSKPAVASETETEARSNSSKFYSYL